jgi:hypothetical protein
MAFRPRAPYFRCELGGEPYFKFLCRLDQAPERAREHNRDHVATYHRVLLELSAGEARSVRWRSGFYEVQDSSSKAVSKILGEPNIATGLGGAEPNDNKSHRGVTD